MVPATSLLSSEFDALAINWCAVAPHATFASFVVGHRRSLERDPNLSYCDLIGHHIPTNSKSV